MLDAFTRSYHFTRKSLLSLHDNISSSCAATTLYSPWLTNFLHFEMSFVQWICLWHALPKAIPFGTEAPDLEINGQSHSFCNGLKANHNLRHLRDCHFMMFCDAKLTVFTIAGRNIIKWGTSTLWFILCKSHSFYNSREENHKVGWFLKKKLNIVSLKRIPTLWFFSRLL